MHYYTVKPKYYYYPMNWNCTKTALKLHSIWKLLWTWFWIVMVFLVIKIPLKLHLNYRIYWATYWEYRSWGMCQWKYFYIDLYFETIPKSQRNCSLNLKLKTKPQNLHQECSETVPLCIVDKLKSTWVIWNETNNPKSKIKKTKKKQTCLARWRAKVSIESRAIQRTVGV